MDLSNLENIEHMTGKDADGNEVFYRLLPKEMIELNMEIGMHHPQLLMLLQEGLRSDAYDISIFFGILFAYCGIVLDSTNSPHGYSVKELCEQASRALINKRENTAVSVNTIPSAQSLVQHLIDAKEESKEIKILN